MPTAPPTAAEVSAETFASASSVFVATGETRLVEGRADGLSFPLALFAQWFSARSIRSGNGPEAHELLADPQRLSRWRDPLVIAASVYGHTETTELLKVVAAKRPDVVASIITDAIPLRSDITHSHPIPRSWVSGCELRQTRYWRRRPS